MPASSLAIGERDLWKGSANRFSAGTPVERKTRSVTLARMKGNGAATAFEDFTWKEKRLPALPRAKA